MELWDYLINKNLMSENKPTPPNSVPEEDLSLHEDFAPIIAENGLIRQPKVPAEEEILTSTLTRIDTFQDLVQIRRAEKEKTLPPQPVPQELSTQELPAAEHTFSIANEESKPQLDLTESAIENNKTSHPEPRPLPLGRAPKGSYSGSNPTDSESISHKKSQEESNTLKESTSTLPAVIPAVNTALVSVRKTKNRKKGLLNKKRKPKKQKKNVANVPPTDTPPSPNAQKEHFNRRWVWVAAVLCLLFLGGIVGVLPVERIPLLRNLAYAMGFSKDDTARMSFLRALLAWTDKTIGLPGEWGEDSSRTSLFARGRTANSTTEEDGNDNYATGLNARMARVGGQTSLIDINALQKLQREKGRPLDVVRGAVMPKAGQEEAQADPAQLRDGQVIVRTESTIVQGDVYFGSDAGAINRNLQDAYDSSKTLTKVKNPHISDGKPIDWLSNMAKKMIRATTSLAGVDRQVENTKVTWMSNVVDVGDEKEHRDLYHAWITSRMSKYTENNMLKKALADSSFLGADLPQTASNVLNFGGVQIDMDSLSQDQKEWQEYLEWEKQCKEELKTTGASGRIDNSINQYNAMFSSFNEKAEANLGFPQDCNPNGGINDSARRSRFVGRINKITNLCDSVTADYGVLGNKCLMQSFTGTCDKSIRDTYNDKWDGFVQYCNAKYLEEEQKWKDDWCSQNKPRCDNGETPPPYPTEKWIAASKTYTQEEWNGQSIENEVLEETGADSEYFSAVVRAKVDENGNVIYVQPGSQENVSNTIVEGMKQNKTL